ncbi:PqiC family protein [Alkalimarinus sediminis]|uniref:PqiC family protein n=1 Tax=Alkalimarinus sediminis TaxID=1632866 RepID=A0A9E8KQF3_9ALTE|nr:PqiC family protein [Alkalimarinus sediminis]UZW74647.1 PqiC family protein [Alkalimarinus sediminis]
MKRLQAIGLMITVTLLMGCAAPKPSAESEFYLLSAPPLPHRQIDLSADLIAVGPVTVADYLKRSSIVTSRSANHYDISKLDQWGGGLEGEIKLALLKNLSSLSADKTYVQYSGLANSAAAYNLRVDVLRFDATLDGQARLEASWAWMDKGRKVVSAGLFSKSLPAGSTIEQSVAVQSELLKQLSEEALAEL